MTRFMLRRQLAKPADIQQQKIDELLSIVGDGKARTDEEVMRIADQIMADVDASVLNAALQHARDEWWAHMSSSEMVHLRTNFGLPDRLLDTRTGRSFTLDRHPHAQAMQQLTFSCMDKVAMMSVMQHREARSQMILVEDASWFYAFLCAMLARLDQDTLAKRHWAWQESMSMLTSLTRLRLSEDDYYITELLRDYGKAATCPV